MRSFYVEILQKCSLEFDRLQQHLEQKKKKQQQQHCAEIERYLITVPLQWLHISHIGISAKVSSPVLLGILFWRVMTVETAHLKREKEKLPNYYYYSIQPAHAILRNLVMQ